MIVLIVGVIIAILLPRFRHAAGAIPDKVLVAEAPDSVVAPGGTTSMVVLLSDSAGRPTPGARVVFTVVRGGGSVAPIATVTDASGRASVKWTVGADTGAKAVTVSAPDKAGAAITVTTTARPPR